MPLIDKEMLLSDGQLITQSAISASIINIGAVAAARQMGFVWFNCRCSVELRGSSTPTFTVDLRHSANENMSSSTSLLTTQAFASSSTVAVKAGTVLMSVAVPLEMLSQYVGLYYTVGNTINAGSVDAWIGMAPISDPLNIQAAIPTPAPSSPPAIV